VPRYQYACTECDEQLEVHQSFTDDALTVCPACQGRLRKVFNAVGVVFKGSGFYKTDSRQSASSSANGSGKDSAGSSGSESSTSDKGSSEQKSSSDKGSGSSGDKSGSGSSSKSSSAA